MEQIIIKGIMIILVVLGIIFFVRCKNKANLWLDYKFWLILSWGVCMCLYLFSGIQYSINLTFMSFFYILAVLGLFCLGGILAKKLKCFTKDTRREKKINVSKKMNTNPLFIISLVCVCCYTVYMFHINDIVIGVTRDFQANWLSTLFLIGSCASLIVWLYELSYAIIADKNITWYGILSFIIFNIPGVVISGRDALIISIVVTVIVFFYSGHYAKKVQKNDCKTYKRLMKLGIVGAGLILFYLIFLSANRYGEDPAAALNMFEWSAQCTFPDYLQFIYYHLGGMGKLIINAVFYYSSQLSKFALMFEEYEGPYLFGFYQLHYVSRLLPDSWPTNYTLVSEQIRQITMDVGIPGLKSFWETAIGYSLYDFGKIGTLLVSFGGGFLTGYIRNWCWQKLDILKIILLACLCTGMFLTVEMSPLFDYFYIFPLAWLGLILIRKKLLSKKRE